MNHEQIVYEYQRLCDNSEQKYGLALSWVLSREVFRVA